MVAPAVDTGPFRHLYPFRSHYMERNGLKLHYLDEGSGPPVVMVHGNPTWSFYYRGLVRALSPNHRVVVPDHMGCGLSDRPGISRYDFRLQSRIDDLEALLEHLGLAGRDDLTLVVHDWGGMIGSAVAVNRPERIRRMVILNTAAFLMPAAKRLPLRLWLIRNVGLLAEPAVLRFNLFARAATVMATRKGLSKPVRMGLLAPYSRPENRLATLRFVQDIPLAPGDPSYPAARRVDTQLHRLAPVPKLILWGQHDFVFDMDYLAEWRRRFPDAEIRLFPGAGHYVLEDETRSVIDCVTDFFKRHPIP